MLTARRSFRPLVGVLVAAGLLSGCMVGPDPTPPSLVLPDAWHAELVDGLERGDDRPEAWWQSFDDPFLSELIAIAEARNLDLRIAESRIREARFLYGIAASDLFPTATVDGQALWTENAKTANSQLTQPSRFYSANLDLAWEPDIWGRVRRGMEASQFTVFEAIENRRDALVSIRAEVARSYLEARSYQGQVQSLRGDLQTRIETLRLVEDRFRAGRATELEVAQARAQADSTAAQIPALDSNFTTSVNRISVLIGESAGPLLDRVRATFRPEQPVPQAQDAIAVGIPANAIRQRPDIRAAERAVMAAAAQIGVAEAALYPSLRFTGSGGFASQDFDEWFAGSPQGIFGIEFSWPIFTAGRLRDQVDVRREQSNQALLTYERTVLEAVAEVETNLAAYAYSMESRRRLRATVSSYEEAISLAIQRYKAGVDDLQTLLTAERGVLEARQQLALVEGQVASTVVGIYKALGGAWEIDDQPGRALNDVSEDESVETQG
ncbi:MAG: efflux transporter outer membrane subunit [Phycisphaera sp.]|nr:efflux transporter outer membrane subunit [Phycisphaera sp.]